MDQSQRKENTSRAWAEIDLEALKHNYHLAEKLTGGLPVMPVIKGDAHGHGAVVLAHTLEQEGAAAFAVACLSEAITLRKAGISKPILILGWTDPALAGILIHYDLTQSVFDSTYAEQLNHCLSEKAASSCSISCTLSVHAKIDTGMTRTGLNAQTDPEHAAEQVLMITKLKHLKLTGIFTHYAAADMPDKEGFTAWQLANFKALLSTLTQKGLDLTAITVHASNSAVIMYHPESHFDMVRMGVMMYGMYPSDDYEKHGELKNVLTLKCRVAQVKDVRKGSSISYGCTYIAPKDMRIAVACAGYADSYPRSLSGKGAWAVIRGKRCPQIGRICMDMCMFDVSGTGVQSGDEVILYGTGGMSHEEIASLSGSINCEHTCLLTERVKKIYL